MVDDPVKPTPTQMVIKELSAFLLSERAEVICIRGRWGVGKTYAWNEALKVAAAHGKIGLTKYSYVSLFGITDLAQLKYAIFENRTSGKGISVGADIKTVAAGFSTLVNTFAPKGIELLAGKTVTELAQSSSFLLIRDQFVCIDDIERKGKDLRTIDILGLISLLVEQRRCKVVIILNDEQLDEKDDFDKYQEKVVDRSLIYAPLPAESIKIALEKNNDFAEDLGEFCTRLNISNIRLIKKIERLVYQIYEIIKTYPPSIRKAHIQTLAVLGWAHFAEHGQPGKPVSNESVVDFVMKRYARGLYDQTREVTETEKRIEATLRMVYFGRPDESDAILNDGIKNGYFDEVALRELADRSVEALKKSDRIAMWQAIWNLLYDTFDDNEDHFVSNLMSVFEKTPEIVMLSDLNHSVKTLKRLGRKDEAARIIDLYTKAAKANGTFAGADRHAYGPHVDDDDVINALNETILTSAVKRPVKTILLELYDKRGWNPQDMASLVAASDEEYYDMFKTTRGDDHRRLIAAALHFREFIDLDKDMRAVLAKVETALRRIGTESNVNAVRVAALNVKPVAPSDPQPAEPEGKPSAS